MGYHPRIETRDYASFLTTRARNSALWFVNNRPLEDAILGYVAKFAERYEVKLYGFAVEGNHTHGAAHFPKLNRAAFMRDLNSCIARAVPRHCSDYGAGRFWARRYSAEALPAAPDIEDYFFYTALQPVQDGLVERISDYPGYNCFHDAIWGIARKFKVVRWAEYNLARKRLGDQVSIKDFTDEVPLRYSRLPGYEHMSREEYAKMMLEKLEKRRLQAVSKRKAMGLGFVGPEKIRRTKPGTQPRSTKTSTIISHRPRVLSKCPKRRAACLDWYFENYFEFKAASKEYRAGNLSVQFPVGMYPPHLSCAA